METLGKLLVFAIIIIIILAVIGFFSKGFGFGKGNGKNSGKKSGNGTGIERSIPQETDAVTGEETSTTTTEAQPTVVEIKYVDVTIKEDKYIYAEKEYDLEGLISQLDNLKDGEHVRIYDGGGLQETLDNLINALDEKHIEYLDETNSENSDNT